MLIDRDWLTGIVALLLGRQIDDALAGELAQLLEQRDEVLPWLILRQHAFADDPAIQALLHSHAAQTNRPATRRPPAPAVPPDTAARQRALRSALDQAIAQAVAASTLNATIGTLLHHENRTLAGTPAYAFRHRISEYPPAPIEPDPGDE